MNDLTNRLYQYARTNRLDLLGVAPIARFADVAANHHPQSIFPEARSVLVIGKRITRGTLRGTEEGTQLDGYDQYGRSWLVDRVLAMATIGAAQFLEDQGWEAVPLQDLPPQIPPSGVAVKPGQPAPNVIVDVRDAAVRAGLGEIGYCGELLTPQYGPRQRCQLVLTDAELDPSPLCATAVCDHCQSCVKACPLGAIPERREQLVEVAGKKMAVAEIDYGKCRGCRNGARPNAYHPAGLPDRLAALCVRTCVDHLERSGRVSSTFAAPFRKRPAWQIDASGQSRLQGG